MILLAEGSPLDHVLAHVLFEVEIGPFTFWFTNHLLMTLIGAGLMLSLFFWMAWRLPRQYDTVDDYLPRGVVHPFFETICEFIREQVARPALGRATDRYIGFIWTLFFFLLFCDLLGMVPLGAILRVAGGDRQLSHWGGTATANISITGGLAVVAFFMMHYCGIRESGWRGWAMHFAPGPWWLWPLMVPLEIILSFFKPFALAIRLFANMVAGHMVIAAILGLIPLFNSYVVAGASVLGALAISGLELFVAFLQAYIFTFLTVLFMASFVHEEHEGEHAH